MFRHATRLLSGGEYYRAVDWNTSRWRKKKANEMIRKGNVNARIHSTHLFGIATNLSINSHYIGGIDSDGNITTTIATTTTLNMAIRKNTQRIVMRPSTLFSVAGRSKSATKIYGKLVLLTAT